MPQRVELQVPRQALRFSGAFKAARELPLIDGDTGPTLHPFAMTIVTPNVINHQFWGDCIHDMAGLILPLPRIAVDYCHNSDEVIGFAEKLTVKPEGLVASGALVSTRPNDRAAYVADFSLAGVPFQCSVFHQAKNLVVEEIPEGFDAQVNDRTVRGPVTIFREWEPRGVAVCPYGADPHSNIAFRGQSADGRFSIWRMAKGEPPKEVISIPAADGSRAGQRFLDAFGEQGGIWFAEGKTFGEAFQLHGEIHDRRTEAIHRENANLRARIERLRLRERAELDQKEAFVAELHDKTNKLREKVKALEYEQRGGEPVSVGFAASDRFPEVHVGGHVSGLDRFAASLRMPLPEE